ncbi:MAG: ATP-dependent Clp protease ATP-binding subunit [Oligoflexia bacterium]|nr:ATP-dependent Clp protease ATP-binding subunit [Oligoflexia bacterium]
MFLSKKKYPIKLEAVALSKEVLCEYISSDITRVNQYCNILPGSFNFIDNLCEDVLLLIENNISNHFKLVFYNPLDSNDIYFEKSYLIINVRGVINVDKNKKSYKSYSQPIQIEFKDIPRPYEFDIFVHFTDQFLSLEKIEQKSILKKFSFKWFEFAPNDVDVDVSAAAVVDHVSSEIGHTYTQENEEQVPSSPSSSLPSSLPFSNQLLIASYAYSDSHKLIEEMAKLSTSHDLIPVLWTYAEGPRVIGASGDNYSHRYHFNDELFTSSLLSPFDLLKFIKHQSKKNIFYILEDFHYYLARDNISSSDYAELISLIKSMPNALKSCQSYLTILAPTTDLPAEISPIFEIIKSNSCKKKLFYLEKFGSDLSKLVLENKIRPVVGREFEIMECLKVLSRMETNNPLLVGKSGVGKTAIVEGLAAMIINGKVPAQLSQKRVISLNLNLIISDTKYRGEFEKRLDGLLEEVKENSKKVIIFIDEIHTLLGMGRTEGSTGAENILKPALSRGEFPCIGATTYEEYDKYIKPDKALSRRFQIIDIKEPNQQDTFVILKGIKNIYEKHHQVVINDQALFKCIEISNQILPNQYYPGKAIKIMDSVCASASLSGFTTVTSDFVNKEFNINDNNNSNNYNNKG